MAIIYNNDLTYNRPSSLVLSNLISVYNPNVLTYYSTISSAETEATSEIVITIGTDTYTFDAIFLGKDASNRYQFKFDMSNVLPAILERFIEDSEQPEIWTNKIDAYENENSFFAEINIDITVSVSGSSDDTDDYDLFICRSVNQFGDEGGSNLFDIYNPDEIPTYHIWSETYSQFSVFLASPNATTNVTFDRGISDFSKSLLDPGFHPCKVYVDMEDEIEEITDGDPFVYDNDGAVFPQSWTPYGRSSSDFFTVFGGILRMTSSTTGTTLGISQANIFEEGKTYHIEIDIDTLASGGVTLKSGGGGLERVIRSEGVTSFKWTADQDDSFHVDDIDGEAVNLLIESISVKLSYASTDKQIISGQVTDDYDTRDFIVVAHKGCEDGINVRYLSRDYAIRHIQLYRYASTDLNVSEGNKILRNIDDMTEETSSFYIDKYKSEKKITCVYKSATQEEQLLWMDIYSSPFVEMLINDIWVRVFPEGSHSMNDKRTAQDMVFTFRFSNEFTQSL